MADVLPIKLNNGELEQFANDDTLGIEHGGHGGTNETEARANLGLEIGVDVQAFNENLASISNITGSGYLVRTGTNTYAVRTINGTNGRIVATNPNGVSGGTVFDLATLTDGGGGELLKFTRDGYGRVSGTSAVTTSDLTSLLNSTYAPINNPTFTGTVTLPGSPTNPLHAATMQWVEELVASGGVPPFLEVQAKTTANINLASPGATHDGYSLTTGDRLLVTAQTNAAQNGIYVFNGAATALTRAEDADEGGEFTPARTVFVQYGDLFGRTGWGVANHEPPVLNTDDITFTQVSGSQSYSNGNGLNLTGTQFSVNAKSGELVADGTGVGLATTGVSAGQYTKVTVDTFGRVTAATSATPEDVGAQPANTFLDSLAASSTNGILVKSGNNVLSRSVTQGAGISVTNGNGVSGNILVALEASGVTAGTYNSVTVDAYGRVTSASNVDDNATTVEMENANGAAITIGRPVYVSSAGQVSLANANSQSTKDVIGLVFNASINQGATGTIVTAGTIEATTTQWDAVTGQSGGLTAGDRYYLSGNTAGMLTTTPPTSGYIAPVGIATSTTTLVLNIGTTIKL